MLAILTGDIINSSQQNNQKWLSTLKASLNLHGQSPKDWEIYRGDSFQLAVATEEAVWAALHLKASLRQTPNTDIRIGIGIGKADSRSEKITESNGPAFIQSGTCFDSLKKNTLAISSDDEDWDEALNVMFSLVQLCMKHWTPTVSHIIKTCMENPTLKQSEIAELLNLRAQSTVSEALKRGGYEEIMNLEKHYRKIAKQL
ncbi:SatD family protein [Reichenbachiella ulvae]|uniref:SatD family protein n=1 Tax=Reichenbachiella ulvae TaxID=2980104 RepID=A0ABT3CRV4_9BACT|nr:SatD family protein [Reichenbachiella ulvae]MCV9386418.1 SatD family protein [Reichenbachiella ulvae]